jgi:ribonuclease R
MSTIGADYFRFDETRHAVIGARTGEMHRLGDPVEVKLIEAAPVAGALRFELLSEGRILPRSERQRGSRSGAPQRQKRTSKRRR